VIAAGADTEARAALYDDNTPLQLADRFAFRDGAAYLRELQGFARSGS